MKNEQIAVAADDCGGAGSQGEFQIDIVLGIPAVGHADKRFEPVGTGSEEIQDFIAQRLG